MASPGFPSLNHSVVVSRNIGNLQPVLRVGLAGKGKQ
jgi:hypothetical protein